MPAPRVIKIQTFILNTIYDRPQDPHFASNQIRTPPYSEMKIFFEIHTSKLTLESGEPLYFDGANDTIHFYVNSDKIPPFLPGRGLGFSIPTLFPTCIDYVSAFAGIQNLAIKVGYLSAARKDAAWLLSQFVNLKVLTITRMKKQTRETRGKVWLKSEEEVLSSLIVDFKAWKRDMDMSDKYVGELKAALEWFKKGGEAGLEDL
ncbi:hypothetical protein BKA61DRAFT_677345 [Leptodontidium sp. MPI-SDFR-AT-0119]|nr:hypothetical protein BKA61DRAFT_677345 [Leptodontidium sp. MPI-SDFR-AT-0119]